MELIRVTEENLGKEHICCAISNERDCQVVAKKSWLRERFADGLIFLKGNVRGKCFIEYLPAEAAWCPVEAEGWMFIDCLWVSGQLQGQGYAGQLLDACIQDSREKGKKGLVILSAQKKRSFLADPAFLKHKGFLPCDDCPPEYVLMCLPFDPAAEKPRFRPSVKRPAVAEEGFVLYTSQQCPFTAKYVPLIEKAAHEKGLAFRVIRFASAQEAQNAPAPFTAYSLFYQGRLLTHEILSLPRFEKLLGEIGL